MNRILDRNIKELITEYPKIADVVSAAHIGCVACSLGSCRLRDIIEIHGLSETEEQALFATIASVVFPGEAVELPKLARRSIGSSRIKKLSPPIKELMDEHVNIRKVIAALPDLLESIETTLEVKKETLLAAIDFIRNYADRFHHEKEEDLLFKIFNENTDIIAAMYQEHETGRGLVKTAFGAIHAGDGPSARKALLAYGALLDEHIRKEDEILYPWMDRMLSDTQIGILFSRFSEVADRFGEAPGNYVSFAQSLAGKPVSVAD